MVKPKKTTRKNKKGAGRPSQGELARSSQGWFRCSQLDMDFIRKAANKRNLTASTFVLRSALYCAEKVLSLDYTDYLHEFLTKE